MLGQEGGKINIIWTPIRYIRIFIVMGKYVITESQLKTAVYAVLDSKFKGIEEEEMAEFVTWMEMKNIRIGNEVIGHYNYFKTSTDEAKSTVIVPMDLVKNISKVFKIRKTKVVDILGDYIEEVHNLPVDDVDIKKS